MQFWFWRAGAAALALSLSGAAFGSAILDGYAAAAKREMPAFAGFSAERGKAFFAGRHGGEWSCSSCHPRDPLAEGQHARTGKRISPLAPAANPQRFTNAAKVEKWLHRNCNDVVGRDCTVQEKGDIVVYLASLKP